MPSCLCCAIESKQSFLEYEIKINRNKITQWESMLIVQHDMVVLNKLCKHFDFFTPTAFGIQPPVSLKLSVS